MRDVLLHLVVWLNDVANAVGAVVLAPVAVLPGWHTTIFPPYFVAGAIYSGFAMVLTLAIPLRKFYGLEALVTERHIDNMGKVMLATGFIVAYGYGMEAGYQALQSAGETYKLVRKGSDEKPEGGMDVRVLRTFERGILVRSQQVTQFLRWDEVREIRSRGQTC